MAGFNEFNERPGLEGNTAAQPRVFGHDAIATTPYWNFTIKQGGSAYDASDVGDTLTGVGNVGVSGNITAVSAGGAVTGFTFISKGAGTPFLKICKIIDEPGFPLINFTASFKDKPLTPVESSFIIKSPLFNPALYAGVSSMGEITKT